MTTTDARRLLTRRYHAQAQRYPLLVAKVPLKLYVSRNLAGMRRLDLETLDPSWFD